MSTSARMAVAAASLFLLAACGGNDAAGTGASASSSGETSASALPITTPTPTLPPPATRVAEPWTYVRTESLDGTRFDATVAAPAPVDLAGHVTGVSLRFSSDPLVGDRGVLVFNAFTPPCAGDAWLGLRIDEADGFYWLASRAAAGESGFRLDRPQEIWARIIGKEKLTIQVPIDADCVNGRRASFELPVAHLDVNALGERWAAYRPTVRPTPVPRPRPPGASRTTSPSR